MNSEEVFAFLNFIRLLNTKINLIIAILKNCSIIGSNLNWRKSVCSLSLFDADEDSLYLVLGTGLNCYVPDRVIEKSLPFILLLMAYSC